MDGVNASCLGLKNNQLCWWEFRAHRAGKHSYSFGRKIAWWENQVYME
jgi:hypothetical protein